VPVLAGDDAETLAARVLAVEHPLLLATVRGCWSIGRAS
jgi:phosphoribosylglycinamide formyltransferase-1